MLFLIAMKAGKICYDQVWPGKSIDQCGVSTSLPVAQTCACCSAFGTCMIASKGDTCAADGTAVPLAKCDFSDGTKRASVPCLCGTSTLGAGEVCYDDVVPNAPIAACAGDGRPTTGKCVSFDANDSLLEPSFFLFLTPLYSLSNALGLLQHRLWYLQSGREGPDLHKRWCCR